MKCVTVVNYGGKKRSCSVLFPPFLFFFFFFFSAMTAKPHPQYVNTTLGRDFSVIYPDIKKKKKKKIFITFEGTLVIIIDLAFRFSLFCVFFFHCCPLFLLLCNQICWFIRRNASCVSSRKHAYIILTPLNPIFV